MESDDKLQRLRLLYDENATQFRFFLGWRHLLLAGYFAIVAALAVGFKWTLTAAPAYIIVCPLLGAMTSFLFWALDQRNRELYQLSNTVGSTLEKELGFKGHFTLYAESGHSPWRHRVVLSWFYRVCGILMLLVAILSVLMDLSLAIPTAPK